MIYRSLTLLLLLSLFACKQKDNQAPAQKAVPNQLVTEQVKRDIRTGINDLSSLGLPLTARIPAEYQIYAEEAQKTIRIADPKGQHSILLQQSELSAEEMMQQWEKREGEAFKGYTFKFKDGFIMETEREGKSDFSFFYRFLNQHDDKAYTCTCVDKEPLSRLDAEAMFSICRSLQGLPAQ